MNGDVVRETFQMSLAGEYQGLMQALVQMFLYTFLFTFIYVGA